MKGGYPMGNETLVKKAKKGNWDAYIKLVFMKKDIMYHKALALMGNEHDASDAIEETILKAFKKIKQLKNAEYFHTWITRILIYTCIDMQRETKKTVYLSKEMIDNKNYNPQKSIDDSIVLKAQLKKLSHKQRNVIVLRYFESMKVNEISEILNIPSGTVKSRIYHGLKNLKKYMKGVNTNEM